MTLELWDVCAKKHGGNIHSRAANEKAAVSKARRKALIHEAILTHGSLTLKEYCELSGCEKNAVSGRFSELKAEGEIYQQGRRDGCGVWYLFPF